MDGNTPPLGYLWDGRTLLVVPTEAQTFRVIFRRHLKLGSVTALSKDLAARGVRSKIWVTKQGRTLGGHALNDAQLRHLLQNRIHVGDIPHRGVFWPGLHPLTGDAVAKGDFPLDWAAQRRKYGIAHSIAA